MPDIKNQTFDRENPDIGKKINPVPKPQTNIGLDIDDAFYQALIDAAQASAVDISQINTFSNISQSRETLYELLDAMAQDSTIAAILEIYAEDATETNDQGEVVWVESSDAKVQSYVRFLLKSLKVDKNIYAWIMSFIKYGDIYLKMFRESDFDDVLFENKDKTALNEKFEALQSGGEPEDLNEGINVVAYGKNDRLVNYVEIVPNPAEMFELTKFGKSYAYIKTNDVISQTRVDEFSPQNYLYRFKKRDIEIYNATSFVHGALQDDVPRAPEQVQIFMGDDMDSEGMTYTVRKGQSILYDAYKIWRQMMLLENALMLNRLTKSSILRVVQVEVADMPKERVGAHLSRVKNLVEQKTSIDAGNKMSEYTNPGAMENNIYVPTHNGIGAISTQQIGGDVNVKDIADIDYFKNKFYASMKIPKQYLGDTDDATGFNGGTSLSIVSSRYAKTVKRIQAAMIQALTDVINILLLDRGLDSYINKFQLRMQPPVTQEELDKRENTSALIGMADDVLRVVGDAIEDDVTKLKITKSLLATAISNNEVIDLIEDYIDEVEQAKEQEIMDQAAENAEDDLDIGGGLGGDFSGGDDFAGTPFADDTGAGNSFEDTDIEDVGGGDTLPTPADLGAGDFVDMTV